MAKICPRVGERGFCRLCRAEHSNGTRRAMVGPAASCRYWRTVVRKGIFLCSYHQATVVKSPVKILALPPRHNLGVGWSGNQEQAIGKGMVTARPPHFALVEGGSPWSVCCYGGNLEICSGGLHSHIWMWASSLWIAKIWSCAMLTESQTCLICPQLWNPSGPGHLAMFHQ